MDSQVRLRQFYVRVLLLAGMLWGGMPFITAPFFTSGSSNTPLALMAAVFCSVSLLPACGLAFWHRRIACVWLTLNALALIVLLVVSMRSGQAFNFGVTIGVAGSIALAVALDVMEWQRWPGALRKLD